MSSTNAAIWAADTLTSAEELEKLSHSQDAYIRSLVARNISTTPEILAKLATDECKTVRWIVSLNPNTNFDTLRILSNDSLDYVKKEAERRLAKTTT